MSLNKINEGFYNFNHIGNNQEEFINTHQQLGNYKDSKTLLSGLSKENFYELLLLKKLVKLLY